MRRKNPALFALLAMFFGLAHAASFDCSKAASRVDSAICASPKVSKLDSDLATAYQSALKSAVDVGAFKSAQRAWIKNIRDACMDEACLIEAYSNRVRELTSVLKQGSVASDSPTQGSTAANTTTLKASAQDRSGGSLPIEFEAKQDNGGFDASATDPRYEATGGIVFDTMTNLSWQRCTYGKSWSGNACIGRVKYITYDDALRLQSDGWRMPTKDELSSLLDQHIIQEHSQSAGMRPRHVPVDEIAFPDVAELELMHGFYWSATQRDDTSAYTVYFLNDGGLDSQYKGSQYPVRLVRTGRVDGIPKYRPSFQGPTAGHAEFEIKGLSLAIGKKDLLSPKWKGLWRCSGGDSGICLADIPVTKCELTTIRGMCRSIPVELTELDQETQNIATIAGQRVRQVAIQFMDGVTEQVTFSLAADAPALYAALHDKYGDPTGVVDENKKWVKGSEMLNANDQGLLILNIPMALDRQTRDRVHKQALSNAAQAKSNAKLERQHADM